MKTIAIILFLSCCTFCTIAYAEDKKQEPKKFKVIFTVQYNAITLADAAKREKAFRALYKEACKVDVKLSEIDSLTIRAIAFDNSGNFILGPN